MIKTIQNYIRIFLISIMVVLYLFPKDCQSQMPESYMKYFRNSTMADTMMLPQLDIKDSNLFRILSEVLLHDSITGVPRDSGLYLFLYRDTIYDDTMYINLREKDTSYTINPRSRIYMITVEHARTFNPSVLKRKMYNYVGLMYFRGHPILIVNRNIKKDKHDPTLFSDTKICIVFPIYDYKNTPQMNSDLFSTVRKYFYYNNTIVSTTPIKGPFPSVFECE